MRCFLNIPTASLLVSLATSPVSLRDTVSLAAAAAKSLQSCPTLCDPIDGSPPASPSLGFSRQKRGSGLPFPSPMHESEKWKWSHSVVSDSSRPHGLLHGIFQARVLEWVAIAFSTKQPSVNHIYPTNKCLYRIIKIPVSLLRTEISCLCRNTGYHMLVKHLNWALMGKRRQINQFLVSSALYEDLFLQAACTLLH